MWKYVVNPIIGLLLIGYGLVHAGLTSVWGLRAGPASWLLSSLGFGDAFISAFGVTLWILVLFIFVGAGTALMLHENHWRSLTITAAATSLLLVFLYWHPFLIYVALINIGFIVALLWVPKASPKRAHT